MSGSLGTGRDSKGTGLTATDHRRILAALYPSGGIVSGLGVTGGGGLSYTVAAGVAVVPRGSDGTRVAAYDGGTVAGTAGDSTYPRIDLIALKALDPSLDGSHTVTVSVIKGTPSASPTAPAVPAGSLTIAQAYVAAGMTSTSTGAAITPGVAAVPYGATIGRIAHGDNTGTDAQDWSGAWTLQVAASTKNLPTKRLAEFRYTFRASAGGDSSMYVRLVIDGAVASDGADEVAVGRYYNRQTVTWVVELPAGVHSVGVQASGNTGAPQATWQGLRSLDVIDLGVA